jgi:hypothetical protein
MTMNENRDINPEGNSEESQDGSESVLDEARRIAREKNSDINEKIEKMAHEVWEGPDVPASKIPNIDEGIMRGLNKASGRTPEKRRELEKREIQQDMVLQDRPLMEIGGDTVDKSSKANISGNATEEVASKAAGELTKGWDTTGRKN